jgi:hypothetical protein
VLFVVTFKAHSKEGDRHSGRTALRCPDLVWLSPLVGLTGQVFTLGVWSGRSRFGIGLVDVADRGADPEGDAVLTITEMEHLIATWVVAVWQNRRLGGHAPAWGPGEEHSPNTLIAAAMEQGGFALQVPRPELYYELLPAHFVDIPDRRGVKIGGLWYDGPAIAPYRGKPSGRGGRH